jgi:hypothetical protein
MKVDKLIRELEKHKAAIAKHRDSLRDLWKMLKISASIRTKPTKHWSTQLKY